MGRTINLHARKGVIEHARGRSEAATQARKKYGLPGRPQVLRRAAQLGEGINRR